MLLKKGNTGSLVQMLQLALLRSGYYNGNLDGIFGENTENALKSFQSAEGLEADGILGDITWQNLSRFIRGYFVYKIQSGDTLWDLAKRFNTSFHLVETANPNLDFKNLQIGQSVYIPYNFPVVPTNIDYSYELTVLVCEGLLVRYPYITRQSIGKSVMGKDLIGLRIGVGQREVFYNASHHANEWITTPVLLKFIEDYANAYSRADRIYNIPSPLLFRSTTLFMAPLVNPDGIDLVTGALKSGEYYENAQKISSDYPSVPFPAGWKANIRGVDLNLNYPAGWSNAREIKFSQGFTSPSPINFVGQEPLSEPESRAVYDFTLNHSFKLTLSYHTQGEVIFWQYLDYEPPEAFEIGEIFSAASGYALADVPYESSFAGYKDWFISNYNLPGYTIEAGLGVNPLTITQFNKIYSDNLGILAYGLSAF